MTAALPATHPSPFLLDVANRLLINGGEAVLGAWSLIVRLAGGVWHAVDVLICSVLSPVFAAANPICTVIGDGVYAVHRLAPVWVGLTILSVAVGVVMLVAFRYTSNQAAIGRAKDDIKANLLTLKLFKDDLGVAVRAQGRLLWAIARLQRYVLTPVLIMMLPMLLGLAQMGLRHQWRPLRSGETTLIRVELRPGAGAAVDAYIEPGEGLVVEAGPVPGGGELVWRIRGRQPGRHTLRLNVAGQVLEKEIVVGTEFQRVSAVRSGPDWTVQVLHPAERILPSDSPVTPSEILYPHVDSWIYGANYWVLYFFVVSMITALILRPVFRVKF